MYVFKFLHFIVHIFVIIHNILQNLIEFIYQFFVFSQSPLLSQVAYHLFLLPPLLRPGQVLQGQETFEMVGVNLFISVSHLQSS